MNTNSKIEQIKDVAILLRKSRGEEEDLGKHKQELEDICKKNGWRYIVYEELGTSAEVEYRPEMQKLLKDIADDLFDAVAVMDKDRLSRESTGQALINKTLIDHDCLIITPHKIYDLSNESDILMSEVEDLFARIEYRMISKRFRRGKKLGAKRGNWVNGTPPFPYDYDAEIKGLVVNEEKLKGYKYMLDNFFSGKTFSEIAVNLNTMGYRTSKNCFWHENSIRRLLLSEVHLGRIIYNKSEGSGHLKKKAKPLVIKPREEWIIVENCHTAIKTMEQHEQIFAIINSRRKVPTRSEQIKTPLSGLIRCGKCGRSMPLWRRKRANGTVYEVKTCYGKDPFGNKCGNSSGKADYILDAIREEFELELSAIQNKIMSVDSKKEEVHHYTLKREAAISELKKKEESLERAYLAYEDGVINLDKYKQRQLSVNNQVAKLRDEIKSYDILIRDANNHDEEEKKKDYLKLVEALSKYSDINDDDYNQYLNEVLKNNIYDILWLRGGNSLNITINKKR